MSHMPTTAQATSGTVPSAASLPLVNHEATTVVIGTPVYSDASGGFKRARANAAASAIVIGLVGDVTILAGATGNVQLIGVVTLTAAQWDAITSGSGGLVAGTRYWLSALAAGLLVAAAPGVAGNYDTLVGQALSPTQLLLMIEQPLGPL